MKDWMKNMICSREWTGNASGMDREWTGEVSKMDREWSRMTSIKAAYNQVMILTFLLIVLGGFTKAWADDPTVTFDATNSSFSGSAPYTITQDSVTFSLNVPNWYNSGNGHFYVYTANNDAYVKWTQNGNFSIAVTGVSLNGQNATHKGGLFNSKTYTGKSYLKSYSFANSSYNTGVEIGQNSSTYNANFTTVNNTNVFPSGVALGNKDYINVYARNSDDEQEGADSNKDEYQINSVTITYTVTPPAPVLKNGSSVTRSQFVEGRSNNTVTLTDYFKPFNSGVSMSYVVKKKNGSGVYETINSGYDITSNVFKTTVVGEYQIFANSNATGAFVASASSPALAVTIEEVRPLTISVGLQELYVDDETTMTITEQLNTTEDVVFDFDENFFAYNESTHALTIKNDGNASFSTIEKSIHVTQASDGEYAAVDMYINFTIKKHDNAISCSWGDESWSKNLNFEEEAGVTFSSNNDTGTPIVVTPGSGVAAGNGSYDAVNHKVVAGHNIGSATWTISQAEDYKYVAATTQTLTVNVGTIASNCYVMTENDQHAVGMYDNSDGLEYPLSDRGDKIYFKAGKYSDAATGELNVYGYNKVGTELFHEVYGVGSLTTSGVDEEIDISDKEVVKIKFKAGNTISKWFSNVRVTRKKWFDIENAGGEAITKIDMPSKTASGAATTATFYVDYSTCDDEIKVVSDHPRITVSDASFTSTTAGRKAITLTYNSAAAEDITATITIYTRYEHETLTVKAETKGKLSTTIEYKGADSYAVNAANMNATDLFQVRDENGDLVASPAITLTTSDAEKIAVVGSNAIDFLCGGSARITASYAGDGETYEAASNSGTIYHDITVNKLADVITWSNKVVNDTLRVYADSVIDYSIASAHTTATKPITFTSGDATIVSVTPGATSDAMSTLKYDTVRLTATTTADCTYSSVTSSIVVVVLPCYHSINWEQSFAGITTESIGGEDINLTAVAVDSTGTTTGVAISYSVADETIAEIVAGNKLRIKKQGETTITATTAASTKYAVASQVYDIRVHVPGVNTAACKNNKDRNDVSDNKIVINAPHAVFTFSGDNNITQYYNTDGYVLASNLKNDSKTFRFTWTTEENCEIKVTRISCWVKAYHWNAFSASEGKASFNGASEENVGTASLTSTSGDYKHFDATNEGGFSSGVTLVCRSAGASFDFYIRNIVIEYEITATTAPTASGETANVGVTVNEGSKNLLDMSALFSIEDKPEDFNYEYELKETYSGHAHIITGTDNFWADAIGTYEVRARVKASADHKASGWSEGYASIQVNRLPNTLYLAGVADYSWDMQLNSTLALALTASNTDYAGSPISVEQTAGADKRISYNQSTGQVTSSSLEGTATWTISQAQSDKYLAAEATFTVNVVANEKTYSGGEIDWTDKDEVTVSANVTIETPVEVYKLNISSGTTITVTASGGLSIGMGGIDNASDNKIKLESNTDGQTGFLRIDPEYAGAMPKVDVEMYSKAYHDKSAATGSKSKYQCVGAPISDEGVRANTVYPAGTWIYTWNESTEGWTSCRTSMTFEAFKGFETTQKLAAAGKNYTYSGHIVSGHEVKTIDLDYSAEEKGYNLLANSFTAPIDIASFDVDAEDGEVDFVNAQQTIYFLNAGTKNQSASPGEGVDAPGKWVGVPIKTAEELANDGLPRMIPSMQGFWVKATGANAQLKLDYSRLVWGIEYTGIRENKPLRARKQDTEEEQPITGKLKISITAEEGNDYLFMLESERYDAAYEDGYDAYKIPSGGVDVFAVEGEDELGVDATNSIIGTKIGLRTGEEYEYTMKFSRVQTEDDLALLDKEEGKEIDIEEGTEYAFFATQNATITDRFEIVSRGNAPAITTGSEGVGAEVKAQKFIKNNSLYIYKDGVLYNALGERVR